jgi:hypothetical protein
MHKQANKEIKEQRNKEKEIKNNDIKNKETSKHLNKEQRNI